jgi:hypothetical protein
MAAERKNEKIGGGYLVFRRGKKTGRVGVRYNTLPFEHPSYHAAAQEAERLAKENPGETFRVFKEVDRKMDALIALPIVLVVSFLFYLGV